jgi:hypothetical protein
MADRQDVIEVLEQDHREVERMFTELEALRGASSDEDKERRKDLTEQVTIEHAEAEETLQRLDAFKKVAPTRPHPNVPNEAMPRAAVGPAASLFDRMRDLATSRGIDD